MSAARDAGVNTTWAGCGPGRGAGGTGTTGWRSTVRRHVAQWRRSQTRAMLWRSVRGRVQGGAGTFGGRGGGGAATWEGARRRSDASDVCVVLGVERSSRRSPSRPALSSRGGGRRGGRWAAAHLQYHCPPHYALQLLLAWRLFTHPPVPSATAGHAPHLISPFELRTATAAVYLSDHLPAAPRPGPPTQLGFSMLGMWHSSPGRGGDRRGTLLPRSRGDGPRSVVAGGA